MKIWAKIIVRAVVMAISIVNIVFAILDFLQYIDCLIIDLRAFWLVITGIILIILFFGLKTSKLTCGFIYFSIIAWLMTGIIILCLTFMLDCSENDVIPSIVLLGLIGFLFIFGPIIVFFFREEKEQILPTDISDNIQGTNFAAIQNNSIIYL